MFQNIYTNSKPYTRWWWFSGKIRKKTLRKQLKWLKQHNFGGVEIAWVYPQPDSEPGPRWLSKQWKELVKYTKKYAEMLELGCDFTFGTLWPFGGSIVSKEDSAKTFEGISDQRLRKSWEQPHSEPGYILDHLDRSALERYAGKMANALKEALEISPSALFCDSWEVHTEKLWTKNFGKIFTQKFGYDIRDCMDSLDAKLHIRYDYRKLISEYVLNEFYRPFTRICHDLGAISRVQCHGAPTDLLSAYSSVDVPESEALLFEPYFSKIAASAALYGGSNIISAEAFTCLYGWKSHPGPSPHQGNESIYDLKLLADALFANGINFIIWHGMPYNPDGKDFQFYASTHVGPESSFIDHLGEFNEYIERMSETMRLGKIYSDVAVYLPLEDNWMKNQLPKKLQTPGAKYHWELRYEEIPEEIWGYHPLWVSYNLLKEAECKNNSLRIRDGKFKILYVDCSWIDFEGLKELNRLAKEGLPICLKCLPSEPGHKKEVNYNYVLNELISLENVSQDLEMIYNSNPLINAEKDFYYWCRYDDEDAVIFIANPITKEIHYPLEYNFWKRAESTEIPVKITWRDETHDIRLRFKPNQSLLVRIEDTSIHVKEMTFNV
ncbi:MAG: hypothetical protein BAJALOKI2v1_280008 [Promethearchaeota archaeon]|nr:MAG: hypothetical protein BAJALOKI2v1_280008 [Candidatus Lokiarchaeota archaeon]